MECHNINAVLGIMRVDFVKPARPGFRRSLSSGGIGSASSTVLALCDAPNRRTSPTASPTPSPRAAPSPRVCEETKASLLVSTESLDENFRLLRSLDIDAEA